MAPCSKINTDIGIALAGKMGTPRHYCTHVCIRKNHFYTMNKPVSIGLVQLGDAPRVVAIIDEFLDMHHIKELARVGVDILEIRLDLLGGDIPSMCLFADKIKKFTGFPCIATVRRTEENKDKRLDIFKAVIPFVDAVDIEMDASIARQVITHAQTKTIIVSEHDFDKTPDISHLESIAAKADLMGRTSSRSRPWQNICVMSCASWSSRLPAKEHRHHRDGRVRQHHARACAGIRVALHLWICQEAGGAGPDVGQQLVEELRLYYPAVDERCSMTA